MDQQHIIEKLIQKSIEKDARLSFDLGTVDYVSNPYRPPILLAKVNRLVANRYFRKKKELKADVLSYRGICVHFSSQTVKVEGKQVHLTHTELEILVHLTYQPSILIPREPFIKKILGYEFTDDSRTINSYIGNLRNKLQDQEKCIVTIIRVGYKFEEKI